MSKGKRYDEDFKKMIVELYTEQKKPVSEIEREYGISNASMESFNAILKKEEVNVNTYKTFKEAKLAIFEFIESWYNNHRIHNTLGYITPNEKFNQYKSSLVIA